MPELPPPDTLSPSPDAIANDQGNLNELREFTSDALFDFVGRALCGMDLF